jgi:hypothetical protein
MGLSESMKSKMMKVVIHPNGVFEHITPNGESLNGVVKEKIKASYQDKGLMEVTVTYHAYLDVKK